VYEVNKLLIVIFRVADIQGTTQPSQQPQPVPDDRYIAYSPGTGSPRDRALWYTSDTLFGLHKKVILDNIIVVDWEKAERELESKGRYYQHMS
jgi:hypothetical protein